MIPSKFYESPSDLDPDKAIDTPEADLLGRDAFAKQLARTLRRWKAPHSLVLSLNGPWGSGKSSIWRLAKWHLIHEQHFPTPPIAEFPLLEISGSEALTATFFARISTALDDALKEQDQPPLGSTFRKYGEQVARGLGLAANIAEAADKLGVPHGGTLQKVLSAASTAFSRRDRKHLESQLRDGLGKLRQPLIAVFDDIDRLTVDEIGLLFRLIKANADFPNFVFLLLFDRDYVSRALGKLVRGRGDEFVEKIVQVNLDVPSGGQQALWRVLRNGVQEIAESIPGGSTIYDPIRADKLIYGTLIPLFRHLRDVRRYLNSLKFHVQLLIQNAVFQVDLIDLAALEAIRLFFPQVHSAIPKNRHSLLKPPPRESPLDADESYSTEYESLISRAPLAQQAIVRVALDTLFPNHGGRESDLRSEDLLRDYRVGSHAYFDCYFSFSLLDDALGREQIDEFFKAFPDRDHLARLIVRHLNAGSLPQLNLILNARVEEIKPFREQFASCIFDLSDRIFSRYRWDSYFKSPEVAFEPLIRELYLAIDDVRQRERAFLSALEKSKGLHQVWDSGARELFRIKDEEYRESQRLVTPNGEEELRATFMRKFGELADGYLLADSASAPYKLYQWGMFGDWLAARQWILKRIESVDGFFTILRIFKSIQQNARDHGPLNLSIVDTSKLVDTEAMERARSMISVDSLSDEDLKLSMEFDAEISRKRSKRRSAQP